MAKLKRTGARVTFSVSVSPETKEILQHAADGRFGGNVSALVEAIALEAHRQGALDTMLHRMPTPTDPEFEAFMKELEGARPSRRSAAPPPKRRAKRSGAQGGRKRSGSTRRAA